jgi:hypothetical protein
MRKYLWVIAFLVFVPCARADTYLVTSGFFQPVGATGFNTFFSGPGFTATGNLYYPGCQSIIGMGQRIFGCLSLVDFDRGILTLVTSAGSQLIGFGNFEGNDLGNIAIAQNPMFLSGATQATLSEPATMGPFIGCPSPDSACHELFVGPLTTYFDIVGHVQFSTSLTQDPVPGIGYDVTSMTYTITTPEPGTDVLLLSGGLLFGLMMRKRIAKGLQQAT